MTSIRGIPVSSGVVIGRVRLIQDPARRHIKPTPIEPACAPAELDRFEAARTAAIQELTRVHKLATEEMGAEAAKIFLFHMGALADKAILAPIRAAIETELLNADYATHRTLKQLADKFAAHPDGTFQSKVSDINDLRRRLLRRLSGAREDATVDLDDNTVIVASDLTPSQTAAFDRSKIAAFATDLGGKTSHTAIVARALGLPAVVGCQRLADAASDGQPIIVDGDSGEIILDPTQTEIDECTARRRRSEAYRVSLEQLADIPAVTTDGVEITLLGNIEFPEESSQVLRFGGRGVGLYRTEFLFLTGDHEPTETDHYDAIKRCIDLLEGRPLTVRTFDLGADKYTQQREEFPERNPFLGLRSIRFSLAHISMFKRQLRAILRASALGPVQVMFPLITSVSELRRARMLVRDTMEDLEDENLPFDPDIDIGMMVEVPSAALQASTFAREVDFFSIGTNDLVQYTLAVDRTNERVANLYSHAHPAVLKLIRDTVRAARRADIPVSCCGESAADPITCPLLIGLGLRTLSLSAANIPPIKRMIRSLSADQCERIAKRAISLDSDAEAAAYTRDRLRKLVPDAFDGRTVDR